MPRRVGGLAALKSVRARISVSLSVRVSPFVRVSVRVRISVDVRISVHARISIRARISILVPPLATSSSLPSVSPSLAAPEGHQRRRSLPSVMASRLKSRQGSLI